MKTGGELLWCSGSSGGWGVFGRASFLTMDDEGGDDDDDDDAVL